MTSQLHRNLLASQAVHGADDITTPIFLSQVNDMSICCPQVDSFNYYSMLEYLPHCINFGIVVSC